MSFAIGQGTKNADNQLGIDELNQALQERFHQTKDKTIQIQKIDENLFRIQVIDPKSQKKITNAFTARANEYGSIDILGNISFFNEIQQLIASCIDTAQLDTVCTVFTPNGEKFKTTTYQNGIKNGLETQYKSDGNISIETQYVNNQKSGYVRAYFTPTFFEEAFYQNGILYGKSFTIIDNNIRSEAMFEHGELLYSTAYHDNHALMMIRHYNHGHATKNNQFYKNGKKMLEEINPRSPNGKPNIKRSYELRKWYPNGQLAVEYIQNQQGQTVKEQYWNEDGQSTSIQPDISYYINQ